MKTYQNTLDSIQNDVPIFLASYLIHMFPYLAGVFRSV